VTTSELMKAMADAGAPLEAIIIAVAALEAKDAEIAARDAAVAQRRAADAARKREERASAKESKDSPRTRPGRGADADPAPPNEYILTPRENPCEAKASQPPFAERVVSAWNAGPAARGARRAQKLDAARRKHLAARVKEHGEEAVFAAIRGIAASDWHCGIGSNGWRANLGWVLENPKRFLEAMERADDAPSDAKPAMTDADRAAYLAKLNSAPHLRGVNTPGAPPGPRSIGQLAAGIASAHVH
jgi:hypothetical protein